MHIFGSGGWENGYVALLAEGVGPVCHLKTRFPWRLGVRFEDNLGMKCQGRSYLLPTRTSARAHSSWLLYMPRLLLRKS